MFKKRLLQWYKTKVQTHPKLQRWLKALKRFTLPGFAGIAVYEVVLFILEEIRKDQIPTRARSIAYSFFIALFPGIIFLFTLLPYIPLDGLEVQLLQFVQELTPGLKVYQFIETTISDLLNKPREGMLSLGFLLTVYFLTQGVVSLIMSFNKSYSIYQRRNFFEMRWVALKLTGILFSLFFIAVIGLMIGNQTIGYLLETLGVRNRVSIWFTQVLRFGIISFLFFFSISLIYHYGPAVKKNWKLFTPGSTLATLLAIAASLIFSQYVSNFGRYNRIYGSLGTIIMTMGWLYANAFILLIGFELNAAIYYKKEERKERLKEK